MNITFLYASLLAILFVVLSISTIRLRRKLKIGVGDAGNSKMLRAMRVHSNFAEYVPFALLLIYFVELNLGNPIFIHCLGLSLLSARISHAFGVSQERENFKYRVAGMVMTFGVIISSSLYLLFCYFRTVLI